MDLKYLNTFRTIVEEGSFSRAAERLNYTQSTITFQMGQLEGEPPPSCLKRWGGVDGPQPGGPAAAALCGPGAGRGGPDAFFSRRTWPSAGGTLPSEWRRPCCATRLPPVLKAFSPAGPGRGSSSSP